MSKNTNIVSKNNNLNNNPNNGSNSMPNNVSNNNAKNNSSNDPKNLKTIAFEIGTEELPAIELHNVTKQVDNIINGQKENLFEHESASVYTTPRRIIVVIKGVPEKIPASVVENKGPAERIAFKGGSPTKAAEGFARGNGIDVEDLELREIDGQKYVFAVKNIPEKNIIDMLPDIFTNLITSIQWKKTQRWGNQSQQFARPIRWLFAMFGDKTFNVEYAGVKSSNVTFGHRFLSPGPFKLDSADKLLSTLNDNYVVLTEAKREDIIKNQVSVIEKSLGLSCALNKNTLQEVVNLCEYPTCMVGEFDKEFLKVPQEIIVDAMLVHQRYFPLFDKQNKLTNKFVIVSNGDKKYTDTIVDGNQRVVAARLYDAKFFYDEDLKRPLESYVEKLKEVVFQEKLGSMDLKAKRVSELARYIAKDAQLSEKEIEQAARAGLLCKADLVTSAVVEFTSVQGIMGGYYAKASDEGDDIATAITEHYKPKFSGDSIPSTKVGCCVAAADKIDTMTGMFVANQIPTGSSDPFAIRRGAAGIVAILKQSIQFSLSDAINKSLDLFEADGISFDRQQVKKDIVKFVLTRIKVMLKDEGFKHDSIDAVSSINIEEPYTFILRVKALDNARNGSSDVFADLATAFARANNLRDNALGSDVDCSLNGTHEKALCDAIDTAKLAIGNYLANDDYEAAIDQLSTLKEPIDSFFDGVMIMDEDESLKNNRIKILNKFVDVFKDLADFSKMAKSK